MEENSHFLQDRVVATFVLGGATVGVQRTPKRGFSSQFEASYSLGKGQGEQGPLPLPMVAIKNPIVQETPGNSTPGEYPAWKHQQTSAGSTWPRKGCSGKDGAQRAATEEGKDQDPDMEYAQQAKTQL